MSSSVLSLGGRGLRPDPFLLGPAKALTLPGALRSPLSRLVEESYDRLRRERRERPAKPANVSIHAPVKGTTGSERVGVDREAVSIHAPAKGATVKLSNT